MINKTEKNVASECFEMPKIEGHLMNYQSLSSTCGVSLYSASYSSTLIQQLKKISSISVDYNTRLGFRSNIDHKQINAC